MTRLTETAAVLPEPVQDYPAVIARPPRIVLGFLVSGFTLDVLVGMPALYEPVRYLGGASLMIAGVSLMAAAIGRFRRAKTAVETWRPTTGIVTGGPYAHTRNPIYVAMILAYAGIGLIANAPAVVALSPLLFAVLHYGVVLREEHYLECKFGDAYLDYKHAVPRWV
jgi:protein-S-isoprenylcysteine O-methyltransferase Ste14